MRGLSARPQRLTATFGVGVLLAGLAWSSGSPARADQAALIGRVSAETTGIDAAKVYAYELATLSLRKVTTGPAGNFRFDELPSGLYKLIAFKPGFQPVIVLLSRTMAQSTSGLAQVVDMELARASSGASEDFWSLRGQVPVDVLRDLGVATADFAAPTGPEPGAGQPKGRPAGAFSGADTLAQLDSPELSGERFETRMLAMRGMSSSASRSQEYMSGELDVAGQFGATNLDIQGRYSALGEAPSLSRERSLHSGETTALTVRLASEKQGSLSVSATSQRMVLQRGRQMSDAALDHYGVQWARDFGSARSTFSAEFTDEDSLFGRGAARSPASADASQTLRLEGSYSEVFRRHSIETGLRYRQRNAFRSEAAGLLVPALGSEQLELFGRGGFQVAPAVVLEYGLFTTLQDGSVSLTPRGGIVLQLSPNWQANGSYSQRLETDEPSRADFLPTLHERREDFTTASDREIQLGISRSLGEPDERLSLQATHREYSDNLRVYFGEDLFDFLENLYFVPGDSLPELQLTVSRRITPSWLAKFESSFAAGGGGVVVPVSGPSYENDIRYVLTSLNTQYLPTSTGVFLAFHRLEQGLQPTGAQGRSAASAEMESLEMVLTQDLSVLLELAADWALRVDVEFSRGLDPSRPYFSDELRHRILGGIAVKF